MPVFARTKLVIHEDCIEPYPYLKLTYSGPNPQLTYEQIRKICRETFKVKEEEITEREFEWEKKGKAETFRVEWEIIKDFDKFTYIDVVVRMSGRIEPSEEFGKEGDVNVVMKGVMRTEYPQDTWWERSMIYEIFRVFFHKVLYREKREEYFRTCKKGMIMLHDRLKEFFNLLPRKV